MWTILTYNWMQYIYISKTCCNLIRWQLRLPCQQQKPLEVLETTPRTRYGWQPWEWAGLDYCWPVVMSLSKRAAAGKLTSVHILKISYKRRFINCLIVFVYVPVRLVFRLSEVVVDHSMSPRPKRLIQQPMTSQNRKRSQRKPKVNRKKYAHKT